MNAKLLSCLGCLAVFLFASVALSSCGGGGGSDDGGFPESAEGLVGYRMEMQVKVYDQFAAHSFLYNPTRIDFTTANTGELFFEDGSRFVVYFSYRVDSEDLTVDESGHTVLSHDVATLQVDLPADVMADKNPDAVLYLVMQSLQSNGSVTLTSRSGLISNLPDTGRFPFESSSAKLYKPE